MYNNLFKEMVEKILAKKTTKEELMKYLLDNIDCEKIYDSDDLLISDVYFSLKHYASGEEEIDDKEWIYLLKCLNKEEDYSMQKKESIESVIVISTNSRLYSKNISDIIFKERER